MTRFDTRLAMTVIVASAALAAAALDNATLKLVSDIEAMSKSIAERTAETTAAATVKSAINKAAKEASEAAAKSAAEAAAKSAAEKTAEELKAEELRKRDRLEQRSFIETRVIKLNHASAAEVAEKLNTMWSGEFGQTWKVTKMAVAYPESNSIMLTAPKIILDACEKALASLDVEAQQVYIEARFVELGNTASHKVGIDWSSLGGVKGTASFGGGVNGRRVGDAVSEFTTRSGANEYNVSEYKIGGTTGRDGSITYFNGTLNFSEMSLTLMALDATEDAKTFSNPKIIGSSGKKALVEMTKKYPNVKVAAKRTEASGSTSLDIASNLEAIPGEDKFMFANEAFFSWGISLEVTPRVGTNGLINVTIVPTISSLKDWVMTGTASTDDAGTISSKYPEIEVQRLVTEFNLASGTTAVIGGLSVTEERQGDTGIPILRSIPWIGQRLFGSMERVKEQKEIIVFVTVGIVNPHELREDAGLPKNAVLGRQYTRGQRLEPGDRPERSMEGMESLDMRLLEEQAKDPLQTNKRGANFNFGDYMPFTKEEDFNETYKERSDD